MQVSNCTFCMCYLYNIFALATASIAGLCVLCCDTFVVNMGVYKCDKACLRPLF